ncbi:unnamed protein product [Rotaria sp. Silwood1]|nr:unnamed protein product [Rotaria sp. Silwood1]CAF3421103.1 unnamed protein product [Rotaria sp. Silwood1]CAF4504521.1 unnamed protein product [Rotaria sp. Silwood1]
MCDSLKEKQTPTSNDQDLNFWIGRWQENKIGFHRTLFKKHVLSKLASSKEQQCVVFPLCGKTLDMKAVLDIGHRVIGIEGFQSAVEAFFKENNIPYEIEKDESNQCEIYKGIDCPVTIYVVDFYTFNKSLPPVDYIWDRGGLVAIDPSNREQYRDCLLRMMTPGHTQLFIAAVYYNDPTFSAPPHIVSDDDVNHLFGSTCSSEFVEAHDETEEFNSRDALRRVNFIEERLHLIVRKQM